MKILLAVFDCQPGAGSERGNGWKWATTLARDHEVVALTDHYFRDDIEAELAANPRENLRFEYVGTEMSGGRLKRWMHYRRWQQAALERGQELHAAEPFDVVHQCTTGAHRVPSELWRLGVPFIWGPVGGGETVPVAFYAPKWLGWHQAGRELTRELSNRMAKRDPRLQACARNAAVLAVSTQQTLDAYPADAHDHAMIVQKSTMERGELARIAELRAEAGPETGLACLYVGRLLGWKGSSYALRAFAEYAKDHPAATFDVYGRGVMEDHLRDLAVELGVADRVTLHGRVPREDVLKAYAAHHVFLFPSLHDSSGYVILEAMAAGLPVVCLDVGGPGAMVPSDGGVKVAPISPEQAIRDLAEGLRMLTHDRAAWESASAAVRAFALDPSNTPTIEEIVAQVYAPVS